jgi:hypothetical protein
MHETLPEIKDQQETDLARALAKHVARTHWRTISYARIKALRDERDYHEKRITDIDAQIEVLTEKMA